MKYHYKKAELRLRIYIESGGLEMCPPILVVVVELCPYLPSSECKRENRIEKMIYKSKGRELLSRIA